MRWRPRRAGGASEVRRRLPENSLLLREAGPSVLVRPSPDWARPTPSRESNLLSSKSTVSNVTLIQKHPLSRHMTLTTIMTLLTSLQCVAGKGYTTAGVGLNCLF